MHQIFISYSHNDKNVANAILHYLEENGGKCWIDYRDGIPGESYTESIIDAIHACKIFVLIYSKSSDSSRHVRSEINAAFNSSCVIIPFRIDNVELSQVYEYYIGSTHWLDAITPPLEHHLEQLAAQVGHILSATMNKEKGVKALEGKGNESTKSGTYMATYEELLDMGYTPEKIASKLVENDYVNFGGSISEENEGTPELWAEHLSNFSETFRYMMDGETIVGDWSITALDDEAFEEMKEGELVGKDLTVDKTEFIGFPGVYNGYILMMYMLPRYRSGANYMLLIKSFFEQVEEYAKMGVFFRDWCINAFTPQLESFLKKVGFIYLTDNKMFGKMYHLPFAPLPKLPILKEYPDMIALYEEYFKE